MWAQRPRATARRPQDTKDPRKKNGRSEERPSSGRKRPGRAAASQSKIAIPRCNNMKKLHFVCKAQSITILDKTPQKPWKNLSQLPGFWLFCCLLQHLCDAIIVNVLNAADSSHCRMDATKESRGSAIPRPVKAGDTRWPMLRGSRAPWAISPPSALPARP